MKIYPTRERTSNQCSVVDIGQNDRKWFGSHGRDLWRSESKDSAQRTRQTECAVCAKALRRKPTWQGSDTQGVQEGMGRWSRADGVGKVKEPWYGIWLLFWEQRGGIGGFFTEWYGAGRPVLGGTGETRWFKQCFSLNLELPNEIYEVCLFFHLYFGSEISTFHVITYLEIQSQRQIMLTLDKNALILLIIILRTKVAKWLLYSHIWSIQELEPELTSCNSPVSIQTSTHLPETRVPFLTVRCNIYNKHNFVFLLF